MNLKNLTMAAGTLLVGVAGFSYSKMGWNENTNNAKAALETMDAAIANTIALDTVQDEAGPRLVMSAIMPDPMRANLENKVNTAQGAEVFKDMQLNVDTITSATKRSDDRVRVTLDADLFAAAYQKFYGSEQPAPVFEKIATAVEAHKKSKHTLKL